MGVKRRAYGRALEGESKKKQSLTATQKGAVKKSRVKTVEEKVEGHMKKLKTGKLGRIAKLKRTARELVGGSKTYLPKKKKV